jgi:hypothetical protein
MLRRLGSFLLHPAVVTLLVSLALVGTVILKSGGDPLALARLGTRFSQGDLAGSEGYDGQFVYYIARDLHPAQVAPYLDAPAYRYQRILLPLLARLLSLGYVPLIPWVLALINIAAHAAGTWAVTRLLLSWGGRRSYALTYGLWVGFLLAIRLDLPEALAYALVALAYLAYQVEHRRLSWLLLGLALFAREVTVLFVLAFLLAELSNRRYREAAILAGCTLLPYALFQGWLWWVFGQPGLGSGGAMATPFELVPFMGLLRIGAYSRVLLAAMAVVFIPAVALPSLWGMWQGLRSWRARERGPVALGLLLNALIIPFLPFSTFREPGGMLRFACGLVLAVLLYAARYQQRRALNYSFLWIVLNVFLVK